MKCPICNSGTDVKIQKARSYYSENNFQIRQCENCELSFTDTTGKELEINNIYKNIYDYSIHDCTKNEKLWRIKNTFSKISKKLNLNSDSFVLDIGCMHGFFLDYLKKQYFCKVLGIETEDYYLKQNDQLNIIKSDLVEFSQNENNFNKFDLIIMSHAFEHFSDPIKVLDCIKKILKKNGKCLIIVPNIDSNLSKFTKSSWGWLQPAAHFFHYSKRSLSKIFNKSNLRHYLVSENGGDSMLLALTIINTFKFNHNTLSSNKSSYLRNIFISIFSMVLKYMYYFGNDEIVYLIEKK